MRLAANPLDIIAGLVDHQIRRELSLDIENWEKVRMGGGEAYIRLPTLDLPMEIMFGCPDDGKTFFMRVIPVTPMMGFPQEVVEHAGKLFEDYYVRYLLQGKSYDLDTELRWSSSSIYSDLKPVVEPFNVLVAALSGRGYTDES